MDKTIYSFTISFLAGISTLFGYIIILINKRVGDKLIYKMLSFSAGIMISVSIIDLIPNSYKMILDTNNFFPKLIVTLIFIVMGIIISMLIDKYIPDNNDSLYKVGIISMIAIIMHNIPEGIATFITTENNTKLGIKLSLAIMLHNVPEGISIALPIYYTTKNKRKAFIYTLISGMSEFLGSILAYLFLRPIINEYIMASLYAIIAGIMLHISFYELIPVSYSKSSLKPVLKYLFIGFIILLLSHILI